MLSLLTLIACGPSPTAVDSAVVPSVTTEVPGPSAEPSADPLQLGAGQSVAPVPASPPSIPVLGGTLLHPEGDALVYASDPDGDQIFAIDSARGELVWSVVLPVGSLPFRLTSNSAALFVSLRGTASIARIDLQTQALTISPAGCAEPRGVAWDDAFATLWVACASGELVSSNEQAQIVQTFTLGGDLRDVVPLADRVAVSHLRGAGVSFFDRASGTVLETVSPKNEPGAEASVAWRMVAGSDPSSVMVSHQYQSDSVSVESPTAYGGSGNEGCDGISVPALSVISWTQGAGVDRRLEMPALAVDVAWDSTQAEWVVASAGGGSVVRVPEVRPQGSCEFPSVNDISSGAVVAVAIDDAGREIVALQHPFALSVDGANVELAAANPRIVVEVFPSGFETFHLSTPSGLACASCHPEGQDDGHTWDFSDTGPRRTQNLAGGLASTAPYHWAGEFATITPLLDEVMVDRMGGQSLSALAATNLVGWIDNVPSVSTVPGSADAVARGKILFQSPELACSTCHAGSRFTSTPVYRVGTGGEFQAPSLLGVGSRAPYMHDGCAETLEDRFTDSACGGFDHGGTVEAGDLPDLVAYLKSI